MGNFASKNRNMKKSPLFILLFTLIFNFPAESQQTALKMKVSAQQDSLGYLVYLPGDYSKTDKTWPLMMFLHGLGERGTDIELVKKNGPPMLIEKGEQYPFIVVSPQCPSGKTWSVSVLDQILDRFIETYRIDTDRIYLTGLSMGGTATWEMAIAYPDRFAAILPLCGRSHLSGIENIKDLPIWVFHGAKDDVVPVKNARRMVKSLKKCGSSVKLTIYRKANHDVWTPTYSNPEVYDWMLEQSKK